MKGSVILVPFLQRIGFTLVYVRGMHGSRPYLRHLVHECKVTGSFRALTFIISTAELDKEFNYG